MTWLLPGFTAMAFMGRDHRMAPLPSSTPWRVSGFLPRNFGKGASFEERRQRVVEFGGYSGSAAVSVRRSPPSLVSIELPREPLRPREH